MSADDRRRVAFITPWYPSSQHVYLGAFVREQALAMALRFDVRVIAPGLSSRIERVPAALDSPGTEEPVVARPPARFLIPRRISWASAAGAFTDAVRATLEAWMRDGWKPDLMHAHTLIPAGWSAVEVSDDWQVPVVTTVHSSFVSQPVLTRSSEPYVRGAMTRATLVAVSPGVRRELIEVEPDVEPVVVPNLIDDGFFTLRPGGLDLRREVTRIVGIGALIPAKRWELLLRAIATLRGQGRSMEACLVGTGDDARRLANLVKKLGLQGHVTFAGALDRDGVRQRLWQADLLVHPSQYETFGVVLAEAMACGVPVVATRSGGPEWVVEAETGQLVDIDDEAALTQAIRRFVDGDVVYDPDTVRGRAVSRFGLARVTAELGEVYERALTGA